MEELFGVIGVCYCLLVDCKGFVLLYKEVLWVFCFFVLDLVVMLVVSNVVVIMVLVNMLGEFIFVE